MQLLIRSDSDRNIELSVNTCALLEKIHPLSPLWYRYHFKLAFIIIPKSGQITTILKFSFKNTAKNERLIWRLRFFVEWKEEMVIRLEWEHEQRRNCLRFVIANPVVKKFESSWLWTLLVIVMHFIVFILNKYIMLSR